MLSLEIHIKAARAANIGTLIVLMSEYYAYEKIPFDEKAARKRLKELLNNPKFDRAWTIHAVPKNPVGYIVLTFGFGLEHGRNAAIDEFYLRETYRQQGIGSQVLDLIEEKARILGIASLHTEAERNNSKALAFWQNRGFQKFDRFPLVKMLSLKESNRNLRN